jgi:hypothetical protein
MMTGDSFQFWKSPQLQTYFRWVCALRQADLESSYAFSDNELYHTFNVAITIHLGNSGLVVFLILGQRRDSRARWSFTS